MRFFYPTHHSRYFVPSDVAVEVALLQDWEVDFLVLQASFKGIEDSYNQKASMHQVSRCRALFAVR